MYLCEFDQELDFDYTLNLRTGIKFKLVWKDFPFDTLGNGERKQMALRVLYSYINSRKKGPSVLLIDSIENHFDLQMLLSTLQTIRSLPTTLQVISTFSKESTRSIRWICIFQLWIKTWLVIIMKKYGDFFIRMGLFFSSFNNSFINRSKGKSLLNKK